MFIGRKATPQAHLGFGRVYPIIPISTYHCIGVASALPIIEHLNVCKHVRVSMVSYNSKASTTHPDRSSGRSFCSLLRYAVAVLTDSKRKYTSERGVGNGFDSGLLICFSIHKNKTRKSLKILCFPRRQTIRKLAGLYVLAEGSTNECAVLPCFGPLV